MNNILFISKYYNNFLNFFFQRNPAPYDSYQSIYDKLVKARYFWSDYYKSEFKKIGYNANQLIVDAVPIQKKWVEENGLTFNTNNLYFDIIFSQIAYYKPEIIYIQDWAPELGSDFIKEVRERCPTVKLIVGYYGGVASIPGSKADCDSGVTPSFSYFSDHDLVICCDPGACDYLKKVERVNAYHIYHAFSPIILEEISNTGAKKGDTAFIGRIALSQGAHGARAKFLDALIDKVPFVMHGAITTHSHLDSTIGNFVSLCGQKSGFFNLIDKYVSGDTSNCLLAGIHNFKERKLLDIASARLTSLVRDQCFGIEMFEMIDNYKILLNIHSARSLFAANLRLFEVTGVGSCLITDWKKNLSELFEPDVEIIVYRNVDEAVEKIQYLLDNPNMIEAISKAGQERALKDHTYAKRAQDMHNIFSDHLKKHYKFS